MLCTNTGYVVSGIFTHFFFRLSSLKALLNDILFLSLAGSFLCSLTTTLAPRTRTSLRSLGGGVSNRKETRFLVGVEALAGSETNRVGVRAPILMSN